jgi:hypothetical protein
MFWLEYCFKALSEDEIQINIQKTLESDEGNNVYLVKCFVKCQSDVHPLSVKF